MPMKPVLPEHALLPTTIEQATNPNRQIVHNKHVIQPDAEMYAMDFEYVHYDDSGKRTTRAASTSMLATGDHYVVTLPGAHAISKISDSDAHLQNIINNLGQIKMEFGKLVIVTKDNADDLYEWLMAAVKKAPWYNQALHNHPNVLQKLGIHAVSDVGCQFINAHGLAVDLEGVGITARPARMHVRNGIAKRVHYENDAVSSKKRARSESREEEAAANKKARAEDTVSAQSTSSSQPPITAMRYTHPIDDKFALIPQTIAEATERNKTKKVHNKKAIETGVSLFDFDTLSFDQYGNKTIKRSSTKFLSTGVHCIITLPGTHTTSTYTNIDPHLQDYIENIHQLGSKFDKLVIVAKGHAGNLYELVMNAVRKASWYDARVHEKPEILQKLGIVVVADPSLRVTNALGFAVDGHKRGIVSKRALAVVVNGATVASQFENDSLVADNVKPAVAMKVIASLDLPPKTSKVLHGEHPTEKIVIVGGGIIAIMKALLTYFKALQEHRQVIVTIHEKNSNIKQTTACNIAPSLTPDEALAVIQRGEALARALGIQFFEPGGVSVSDIINQTEVARKFIAAVEAYGKYEQEHKDRTNAMLQFGKFSMDAWQKIYDMADADLKQIFKDSNFNPCDYRVDIIYNTEDARSKADGMMSDYLGIGYKDCKILSPAEVMERQPSLTEFCHKHSEMDSAGTSRVWKKDAVGLLRPGGCLNVSEFLPKVIKYLTEVMGKYTNEDGKEKDCFRVKLLHEVNGVIFGDGLTADDSNTVKGIKFRDLANDCDVTKTPKHKYDKVNYVIAGGGDVGLLTELNLMEPPYAAFAGASLTLKIPIPADFPADKLEALYARLNQWMEVHQPGVVLAWQAKRVGDKFIIAVAGTKGFVGDSKLHKDHEFTLNRNLLQLNMIREVLPEILAMTGLDVTRECTSQDLQFLADKGFAHRWTGNRGVVADGLPLTGPGYKADGTKIDNLENIEYLGSGGVSLAPAACIFSDLAMGNESSLFPIPDSETLRDITRYTSACRNILSF